MSGEKQFAPSAQKLNRLRRKGIIPLSPDFRGAVPLAAIAILLAGDPGRLNRGLSGLLNRHIEGIPAVVNAWFAAGITERPKMALALLAQAGGELLRHSLPLLALVVLAVSAAGWLQTGGLLSAERLAPRFENLNPVVGLRRLLFDRRGWIEQGRLLVKVLLVSLVLWTALQPVARSLAAVPVLDWAAMEELLRGGLRGLLLRGAGIFLVLGLLDLLLQKFLFQSEQRMTREELAREQREIEGNPWMRAVRKSIGRDMVAAEVRSTVPRCDLILNNPTHLSVGVRFSRVDRTVAWIMVKGGDQRASLIREEARRAGIPMIENRPLARALMRVPEKHRVPRELFLALREVLAWLQANATRRSGQRSVLAVDKTDDRDKGPGFPGA